MAHNRAAMEMFLGTTTRGQAPVQHHGCSRWTRLRARLSARRLDNHIEGNAPVRAGSVLAAHAARITSFDEREQLARSLRSVVRQAGERGLELSSRVPVDREAVLASAGLIEDVAVRMHTPAPVRARGMARLRILLGDGGGPLYRRGSGSLAASLRGVLAAL